MTTEVVSSSSAQDLVPLRERLRYFWMFRLLVVAVVPVFAALVDAVLLVDSLTLVGVSVAYLAAAGVVDAVWRGAQGRMLGVFAAVLILDALYLAFVAYAAGDSANQLRYLTLVHLVVVALLASYRTGLKLALWHSVLAFLAFFARASIHFPASTSATMISDVS